MPKKLLFPLPIVLSAAMLLSACGQKGPLYLPQDPAMPATNIPGGPPETVPTSGAAQPGEPGSAQEQAVETVDDIESADGVEPGFDIDDAVETGPNIDVDDDDGLGTGDESNVAEDLEE
ncbi:lipoprotein [Microbulbifer sp. OS29]|uniref:Lipoprotein n=1 Tax=Microbulbifer okhotskensis TaxID=2926617 RepID=A0A9X2J555_9GAMM|nr:lipoprotein [Microbulbifer okhotskensis]MCO1334858.1 lipoprotein [Microbulbifer okhotskensis]